MGITRTTSGADLPSGFPFALAGTANGLCFISGMPALNPEGTYQEGTFEEEVALAWHNITSIANAAGFSVDEIVYVQCVIADIANYGVLNDWWRRQFPDLATAPARFTFQAGALPFRCKIEIQAVAAHDNRRDRPRRNPRRSPGSPRPPLRSRPSGAPRQVRDLGSCYRMAPLHER